MTPEEQASIELFGEADFHERLSKYAKKTATLVNAAEERTTFNKTVERIREELSK